MISLRQSMKDIDEAEALHRAAAKAFAEAVSTSAEHVVEVNRHEAETFREQVLGLAGRLARAREPRICLPPTPPFEASCANIQRRPASR